MKFSEIAKEKWQELRPYLDTCLLPVTMLDGTEEPWQAADRLEELRDVLDLVEIPFMGRVVTYPAFHYADAEALENALAKLCGRLKDMGFVYLIVAFRELPAGWTRERLIGNCDMWYEGTETAVREAIMEMWGKSPNKA